MTLSISAKGANNYSKRFLMNRPIVLKVCHVISQEIKAACKKGHFSISIDILEIINKNITLIDDYEKFIADSVEFCAIGGMPYITTGIYLSLLEKGFSASHCYRDSKYIFNIAWD